MRFLCRLGLHRWPKWSDPKACTVVFHSSESRERDYTAEGWEQFRRCPACNLHQRRLKA